ncbi:MAG: TonB-dependent receptor [Woeseiaceae bacterium]
MRISPASIFVIAALPLDLDAHTLDEIVVTSQRRPQVVIDHVGNIERLDRTLLADIAHQHIHELMTRVPGVWLSRGSGQEHLTAIRSPVLTGAGSCGGFLFLEDGIPIQPSGFCNVNQLFDINTEQAQSLEIVRGPGSALYGSNALHGIVNVLQSSAVEPAAGRVALEVGANEFLRWRFRSPTDSDRSAYVSIVASDDGGFRDDSGYRQLKAHARIGTQFAGGDLELAVSVTDLDQETAGFIVGEDAYEDPDGNRSNPNPEAFRNATSRRLYALWRKSTDTSDLDIRPFIRHSDMEFLQHFLPGQPLEENGHVSAGVLSAVTLRRSNYSIVTGLDVEWANVFLRETQLGTTEGSDFLVETRPPGKHYDYDVSSYSAASYVQADIELANNVVVSAGLRGEYVYYDYDNRMLVGNSRDDGTPCGFGGCLYSRPADRSDGYTNLAPKIGLVWSPGDSWRVHANLARGFRAPQMTELYRLQSGQQVADLDPESIDSFEVGLRAVRETLSLDISAFAMRKRDSVFREANGFNVSGARSRHSGIEAVMNWQLHGNWRLRVDGTYARHTYDFDRVAARGETFVSGNDVDTAPRWIGSAELFFDANERFDAALQLRSIGRYYVDAENRFTYPGHEIANLRLRFRASDSVTLTIRINNIAGTAIADRADFAFGNHRYFPGRGREGFLEIRYSATRNESP